LTPTLDLADVENTEKAGLRLAKPKFGGVALVCCECEERSDGPSKLKSRQVRKIFKGALRDSPVRLRVVQCTCLGICPRKAIAATVAADGMAPLAAEIRSEEDAEAAAVQFVRALKNNR
jgi:predicted metal-binding protein